MEVTVFTPGLLLLVLLRRGSGSSMRRFSIDTICCYTFLKGSILLDRSVLLKFSA